jgi:hypothetical protein
VAVSLGPWGSMCSPSRRTAINPILATAFELAIERHWNNLEQLIPWLALAVLAVATVLALAATNAGYRRPPGAAGRPAAAARIVR